MSLILYAQLVFGILFEIRTLQLFRARALINTPTVTKIGTIFVCTSLCISFFGAKHGFLASILLFGTVFFTTITLFVFERRQIDGLKSEVPVFLDRWILNLRLGHALPTARETALLAHSESFKTLLRPMFALQTNRAIRRGHLLFAPNVLDELERIQFEPHSALARLENLRQMFRKASEFRRKSGQATRQTYIQCVVMLVLLFALTLFTLHRYGWSRSFDLVLGAVSLSLLGVVAMYWLARKTKWKI